MYIPRHYHQVFPVATILLGFYIAQNFQWSFDVIATFISLQVTGVMHAFYLMRAGELYQAYITGIYRDDHKVNKPISEKQREPQTDIGFVPLLRPAQSATYTQTVVAPKIDKQRDFAIALLRMFDFDPSKVDLTEDKWVKSSKKFSRTEFVNMLDRWKKLNIIDRKNENRNSPWVVSRWELVRLIAQGETLPPPPR